jgi:pyruvate,water dikinase
MSIARGTGCALVASTDLLVGLDDLAAGDRALTGGKAAALAIARRAGLPVLPGVVLTTRFTEQVDGGADIGGHPAVAAAFDAFDGGRADRPRSLVVRSSSVLEDMETSSAAGQYESVIGVEGLAETTAAVNAVLSSRSRAGTGEDPIAVLVQPLLVPRLGGVYFSVDPVTGRSDHRVITAVDGLPAPLVSGEVTGSRYVIDGDGSIVDRDHRNGPEVSRWMIELLRDLGDRVERVFGGPQDIEWAIDTDDRLWLLQARPITTIVRGVPSGPVYGRGPVAETFPDRLAPLEADMWVPPLNEAVAQAMRLAARPLATDGSPLVTVVDGYVVIDLDRAGETATASSRWSRVNPIAAGRRLRSAWRVGRLRSALPKLGLRLADRVDADLESLPHPSGLTDHQLLAIIGRGRHALRALHAHEILLGMLTDAQQTGLTGAAVAMRVLAEQRARGMHDVEIVATSPVVLTLTAPHVQAGVTLPTDVPAFSPSLASGATSDAGVAREALRLRVRWVQEATGRAAWELGRRLRDTGALRRIDDVRGLQYDELVAIVARRASALGDLLQQQLLEEPLSEALPARFQLSDRGLPIAVVNRRGTSSGTGAGGGQGQGAVTHRADDPPAGSVLVVRTFEPSLGPKLERLAGLVAETGSVLSHLAILAREAGVPTIVAYAGALDELPEGTAVKVDGNAGTVEVVARPVEVIRGTR